MIGTVFELSASLFDSILCIYFITKFCQVKYHSLLSSLALVLIYTVTLLGDFCAESFSFIFTILIYLTSLIYALIIGRKKPFVAICATCIYHITLIILSTLLFYSFSLLFNNFTDLLYGVDSAGRYAYVITHKVLLLACLRLVITLRKHTTHGNVINGVFTFLFSIITVLGLAITISITNTIDASLINTQLLSIALVFLFLNIFLYILLTQISRLQKKNYDLELLSEKAQYESDKYQEALIFWKEAQKHSHDVKHHMAAIIGMIENNEIQNCTKYIEDYLDQIQKTRRFSPSGNSVLDYLIHSKLSALTNTEIIIVGNIGDLSDIADVDLASLIGNILDNAVEAEEKVEQKRIELLFRVVNNNRIIICKNNISSSVLAINKQLQSTKSSPHKHGYGHQIVADIVQKYNGLIEYFEEYNMFGVQIVLPNSKLKDMTFIKKQCEKS